MGDLRIRIAEWATREDEARLLAGIRHWIGERHPESDAVEAGVPFALVAPPPGSQSLIERYTSRAVATSRAERTLLARWERSRFLILRVVDVAPEKWIDVHDVVFDTAFRIHERSGSRSLPIGTWLAAFVFDEDGRWQLEGTVVAVPRAARIQAVQAAVKALEEIGIPRTAADARATRRMAWQVIAAVHDGSRTPHFVNSEGHEVVLVTSALGETWQRVLEVTSRWDDTETSDDTVTVLGRDPEALADGVVSRGNIHHEAGRVLLFANSRERHDEIVQRWADTSATPLRVRSEDVQRPPSDPRGPTLVVDMRPVELPPDADPEQATREVLAGHAESWPDTPIPALDGLTPRQAVRRGRSAEVWALFESEGEDADLAVVLGLRTPPLAAGS